MSFVQFGRGEDNKAEQLLNSKGEGYEPSQRSKVEPMTLKAPIESVLRPASTCPRSSLIFLLKINKIGRKS